MAINTGATEQTPSYPHYFTWINNTNEGSTEEQTLANLDFFAYLQKKYQMRLAIYAFDAGNLDNPADGYGSMESEKFRRQFPRGFAPIAEKAKELGISLGLWGGPDGFGNTPEEEEARKKLLLTLCRDDRLQLLKIDSVCGGLRPEKQAVFRDLLDEIRRIRPDFILLNHRLDLGLAADRSTTFLWEGAETYVDVFLGNRCSAPHHRAGVMSRGLPPELRRLSEDHGVCLSSCLDYWEDDMILQAFNRCMILAPEMYGNPWLLRDDELPRLARIYNLHRRYASILVNGMRLPEKYGPNAVSRGSGNHRFLTLRNLTWETVTVPVTLGEEIGLTEGKHFLIKLQHPREEVIGFADRGETVNIPVLPFRSCLVDVAADTANDREDYLLGCPYERTSPEEFTLLGLPGQRVNLSHYAPDGRLLSSSTVLFEGEGTGKEAPVRLGALERIAVPTDAESLYEATVFSADNNSLEKRSLERSGPTAIPEVKRARELFFAQETYRLRGIEDGAMFDGDPNSLFDGNSLTIWGDLRLHGGTLRIDCGKQIQADRMVITCFCTGEAALKEHPREVVKNIPIPEEGDTSPDLQRFFPFHLAGKEILEENSVLPAVKSQVHTRITLTGDRVRVSYALSPEPFRYLRLPRPMNRIFSVEFFSKGQKIALSSPRGSNLFAPYGAEAVIGTWKGSFTLPAYTKGSYLCVCAEGVHGANKVYAAAKLDGSYLGAPDRAPSYPSNVWEFCVHTTDRNNTFYIPLREEYAGKTIELYLLLLEGGGEDLTPQVYLAYDKERRYTRLPWTDGNAATAL